MILDYSQESHCDIVLIEAIDAVSQFTKSVPGCMRLIVR